jgi:16S rRNA (uracil1498-N3)-methyltransferase
MRIPRIYYPNILHQEDTVILTEQAAKHVLQVLRLQMGAQLTLFNGKGGEYQATISHINKRSISVVVGKFSEIKNESPLYIHLGQAISRGEKMDFTILKAVELGVSEITPLISERCNVKLPEDRLQKKLAHWQAIIISACEQSGRNFIPILHTPIHLNHWIAQHRSGMKFILHPADKPSSLKESIAQKNITLLVGSEGGFTEGEMTWATENHFQPVTLGPRILRTETAALAAISVFQGIWGDFIY